MSATKRRYQSTGAGVRYVGPAVYTEERSVFYPQTPIPGPAAVAAPPPSPSTQSSAPRPAEQPQPGLRAPAGSRPPAPPLLIRQQAYTGSGLEVDEEKTASKEAQKDTEAVVKVLQDLFDRL